jgi:DNA-binding NtrC family response regulator
VAPHIYLFEDDDSLRELLSELLTDELGAQVEPCSSLADLEARCRAQAPDLIVADFWGTSHLTLSDKERSEISELAAIAPVVLVSARNWALNEQATDLGVVALMPKPLDIDGLLSVLRSVLGSSDENASKLSPRKSMSLFVLGWP